LVYCGLRGRQGDAGLEGAWPLTLAKRILAAKHAHALWKRAQTRELVRSRGIAGNFDIFYLVTRLPDHEFKIPGFPWFLRPEHEFTI
jgi:hypothetical protein